MSMIVHAHNIIAENGTKQVEQAVSAERGQLVTMHCNQCCCKCIIPASPPPESEMTFWWQMHQKVTLDWQTALIHCPQQLLTPAHITPYSKAKATKEQSNQASPDFWHAKKKMNWTRNSRTEDDGGAGAATFHGKKKKAWRNERDALVCDQS